MMETWSIPLLKVREREVKYFLGGMGVRISGANLASAVTNDGGLGVISSVGLSEGRNYTGNYKEASSKALVDEIAAARSKITNNGPLGVNIMRALTNYDSLVATAIDSKVDFIISGAGLPTDLPSYLKADSTTMLIPIVSSARAAEIIMKNWKKKYNYLPDAIVVEGPKAGGHLGFKPEQINDENFRLEKLIPEVVAAAKSFETTSQRIPVVAAGGIYYGGDIRKFLELGASGVQMATRFVTTDECDADIRFKEAYLNCKKEDLVIIKSPVGMPGRAIKNKFLMEVEEGIRHPVKCPYHCLVTCEQKNSPYCIAQALIGAQKGEFQNGYVFAGANAHLSREIISVKELNNRLNNEYLEMIVSE